MLLFILIWGSLINWSRKKKGKIKNIVCLSGCANIIYLSINKYEYFFLSFHHSQPVLTLPNIQIYNLNLLFHFLHLFIFPFSPIKFNIHLLELHLFDRVFIVLFHLFIYFLIVFKGHIHSELGDFKCLLTLLDYF